MTLKEVQQIAKNMGIAPKKMNKTQLIQTIQTQENNTPCFSCGDSSCQEFDCLWREDCIK